VYVGEAIIQNNAHITQEFWQTRFKQMPGLCQKNMKVLPVPCQILPYTRQAEKAKEASMTKESHGSKGCQGRQDDKRKPRKPRKPGLPRKARRPRMLRKPG